MTLAKRLALEDALQTICEASGLYCEVTIERGWFGTMLTLLPHETARGLPEKVNE